MSQITVKIDGKEVKAQEGEYILNVARANGTYIPALCYLTRCKPTLACRICLVEADGKQVYGCNVKVKDGMEINTLTDPIAEERRAIMEVYDVNHPLECGVCDQSGECELQNYTLNEKVDSQSYYVADSHRPTKDWGLVHYDPALCIVCERCVTACKDMVGDSALKTVKRGGPELPKTWKEEMPKDAYAMWNKLNKSIIDTTSGEALDCTFCGECIAVCPVGALVSSDMQYTTNAWELTPVPASCAHCSTGCQQSYEVKHTSIENNDKKIYRVKNEWNYISLCGAGRFGYDFENRDVEKNLVDLDKAVFEINNADTIRFNSFITNEEAQILQSIKEKNGIKLVNDDARRFQKFMNAYSEVTGEGLYSANKQTIHDSDFIVSVGSALKTDNPGIRFAMNNALTMNKGAALYFHPVGDPVISSLSKTIKTIEHKPAAEESVMYLLLDLFAKKDELPEATAKYLASFHEERTKTVTKEVMETVTEIVVDKETGEESTKEKKVKKKVSEDVQVDFSRLIEMVGEDIYFEDTLADYLKKKESFSLIIGEDAITHPRAENIARLAGLIEKYTEFNVLVIPPQTNTLGVSLICDLDDEAGSKVVGYNESGDFVLSALGDGDLDMPALNQQEGTFTNLDKRVVPTNVALPYGGYTLNDIANELGLEEDLTINYTAKLPTSKGYEEVKFDDLPNHYTNTGEEVRGYLLNSVKTTKSDKGIEEIATLPEYNGTVIYRCEPVLQFNQFTNKAHQLNESAGIYFSPAAAEGKGLNDGDTVNVSTSKGNLSLSVKIDDKISGDIAYVPTFDKNIDGKNLFDTYRFIEANIEGGA